MYTDPVTSKCVVSFREVNSHIAHEVQVEGSSLYEAVARALKALEDSGWRGRDVKSDVIEVKVLPKQPIVTHRVLRKNFDSWLYSQSGNPEDIERKKLVRQILGRSAELGRR